MVTNRKLLNLRMREQGARVDPKRIRRSGVGTIVGGLVIIAGTFLPFNTSSIDALVTVSRNAYQLGSQLSDNGIGVIDSIFGVGLAVLGFSILRGYRGYWFDPLKHSLGAFVTGIVIFNQRNADSTTLSLVHYSVSRGWYISLAGAALCSVSAFVRFPSKVTALGLDSSSLLG
jgi:hypothetical protein